MKKTAVLWLTMPSKSTEKLKFDVSSEEGKMQLQSWVNIAMAEKLPFQLSYED